MVNNCFGTLITSEIFNFTQFSQRKTLKFSQNPVNSTIFKKFYIR